VALVMGAFTTLGEAERTTHMLLADGVPPTAISATSRSGGGRLLLADRVPVHAVGEPARLVNRTERIGASALIGGVAGALLTVLALFLLPLVGIDPMFLARGFLSSGMVIVLEVLLGALVAATVAALLRRTRGLPHDLAVRYAMRLDQGDTVLAVQTASAAEARAAQETMAMNGALLAHVTAGTLEPIGEPPAAVGVAASQSQN
jgi:hypothetical protein